MKRKALAALALLGVLSGTIALGAVKQILVRTDGQTLIGEVTKKDGVYEVVTDAGRVMVPADQVASVKPYASGADEYARRRDALKADDAKGHYALALWCEANKLKPQYKAELKRVLALEPDHENAKLRLQLLEAEAPTTPGGGGTTEVTVTPPPAPSHLMTETDIQRIRLVELRSTDLVGVAFEKNVLERYIEKMQARGEYADRKVVADFRRQKPVAKALAMYREFPDDAELLGDIRIRTDGPFMRTFQTRIWPMIERNCASSACHGGANGAGKLRLYTDRPVGNQDPFYFTNFYILDSYARNSGRMIDRNAIGDSLLLQYGLPKGAATKSHPKALTSTLFRRTTDPKYTLANSWIRDLQHPHRGYRVEYKIPGQAPARPSGPTLPDTALPRTGKVPRPALP